MGDSLSIEIMYENRDFVLIDKPEGISFHSESDAGIVVLAQQQLGYPLFSVHRLDKITSGLLLLAKNAQTANELSRLFEQRTIEKYYVAISVRKPKKKQGWIKGDMQKSRRGSYKLLTTMENPAVTRFISTALREHERLFLIKPYTGKTHQIRVALKAIGAPIAGDERYADALEAKMEERTYLHAYALRFELFGEKYQFVLAPHSGERFESDACCSAIGAWDEPWKYFS